LEKSGHRFYTQSDTEVIVHLYEQFGDEFVQHLNGQFAIALWDSLNQRLLLIRDRVGIHPLFYSCKNDKLYFASEVKAMLPAFGEPPTLNEKALDQIMTFWAPVGSITIFKDVYQVEPGQMLVVEGGSLKHVQYWDWIFPSGNDYAQGSDTQLALQLHEHLLDATRLRLRADVPVGAYLSGGLDSSVLTTLIHQQGHPLRTFSIGFDQDSLDEGDYQSTMIDFLKAQHSRAICRNVDIADNFQECIWHGESPILRTAPVPMMILSRLVRQQGYKVVLTGEGADEVLGGYDLFKEAKIRTFWAKNPDSSFRPLLLQRLYPYLDLSPGRAQTYLQAFFGTGIQDSGGACFSHIPRWNTTTHCKLFFSQDLNARLRDDAITMFSESLPRSLQRWHQFNKAQYIEAKSLMAGYLLCSQGDRMLMANSVEGRFPFLDHRVIEFANQLHPNLKMKVLNEKYILKQAMQKELPETILKRYKQPYRAPDIPAFLNGDFRDYVQDMMAPETVRRYGYFDDKKVAMLMRKILAGRSIGYKDNMAFVGILSTQVWHKHFVDNYYAKFTF
jgi:asparagine synthase (glutamine-hydrolysing)